MSQCSLCGSPGTNKTTCPLNPDTQNANPEMHPLANPPVSTLAVLLNVIADPEKVIEHVDYNTAMYLLNIKATRKLVLRHFKSVVSRLKTMIPILNDPKLDLTNQSIVDIAYHLNGYSGPHHRNGSIIVNTPLPGKVVLSKGDYAVEFFQSGNVTRMNWYDMYKYRKLHRIGGPAEYNRCTNLTTEGWYEHGKLHRIGGPAIRGWLHGKPYREVWYEHGKLHRIGGPADIEWNNDIVTESYYHHGEKVIP